SRAADRRAAALPATRILGGLLARPGRRHDRQSGRQRQELDPPRAAVSQAVSADMNYGDPELIDLLAAEYVLGTLRGRARQRFERVATSNTPVRAGIAFWEERLLPLAL